MVKALYQQEPAYSDPIGEPVRLTAKAMLTVSVFIDREVARKHPSVVVEAKKGLQHQLVQHFYGDIRNALYELRHEMLKYFPSTAPVTPFLKRFDELEMLTGPDSVELV